MWYYESNGLSTGPVSKGVIAQALRSGTIGMDTLVCQKGSTTWLRLGDTELAILTLTPPTEVGVQAVTPLPSSVSLSGLDRTFWWWVGLAGSSLLFLLILIVTDQFRYEPGWVILSLLPLLAACVFEYVMISKHWKVVQDGNASKTPGKAVGYLFIPAFAIYWLFPAHFGLVKDQQRFIQQHTSPSAGVRPPTSWVTWTYLILYWLVWAFLLVITICTIIYNNTYYYGSWEMTFYNDTISIILLVMFLVQMVARWGMLVDHYLTSRSIIQNS